jgi:hypothetical protein
MDEYIKKQNDLTNLLQSFIDTPLSSFPPINTTYNDNIAQHTNKGLTHFVKRAEKKKLKADLIINNIIKQIPKVFDIYKEIGVLNYQHSQYKIKKETEPPPSKKQKIMHNTNTNTSSSLPSLSSLSSSSLPAFVLQSTNNNTNTSTFAQLTSSSSLLSSSSSSSSSLPLDPVYLADRLISAVDQQ